jgi:glycosyltransferase involved in cell wall biosynthesis
MNVSKNLHGDLRISLVIPVYNEAGRIAACLESIAQQTIRPFEVIVVDNNSSDNTVEVASRYPFARVISAKRQGVVHARNRGFNAVRGDIIGRIDADTHLPVNWVETVQILFADASLDAVSGAMGYHDLPLAKVCAAIDLKIRRLVARRMGDEVFLQGANMAMRRDAWLKVRSHLCLRGGLHEDFDLAIHLSRLDGKVRFDERLKASISARCLDDTIKDFWSYALLNPGTYAQHNLKSGRHMYLIVTLILFFHVPLRALYRGANTPAAFQRVNPATFVE